MAVTILIISACLSVDASKCKEFKIENEEMNYTQCVMSLPITQSKWQIENPQWIFKSAKCIIQKQNSDGTPILEQGI